MGRECGSCREELLSFIATHDTLIKNIDLYDTPIDLRPLPRRTQSLIALSIYVITATTTVCRSWNGCKMKKPKTSKILSAHAKKRAEERYGLNLNHQDRAAIVNMIQ